MFAVPLNDTPPIVRAVCKAVAVLALPVKVPVTLPVKFPAKVLVMSKTAAPAPAPSVKTAFVVPAGTVALAPDPCDKITVCDVVLLTQYSFRAVLGATETVFVPLGVPVKTNTAN